MTVVAVIFVPVVLAYQGWTYWVFRHRLGRDDFEGKATPLNVLASINGKNASTGEGPPVVPAVAPEPAGPAS
jgi:hypothetical protein